MGFLLTFFFEDSIYYFVEKKDMKRVYEICKYYFKDFKYELKDINKILSSNNNNSIMEKSIIKNQIICNDCKKFIRKISAKNKKNKKQLIPDRESEITNSLYNNSNNTNSNFSKNLMLKSNAYFSTASNLNENEENNLVDFCSCEKVI